MWVPFTASIFPNETCKPWAEAGSNPDGVSAIAAPASATAVREAGNMIETDKALSEKDVSLYNIKLKTTL